MFAVLIWKRPPMYRLAFGFLLFFFLVSLPFRITALVQIRTANFKNILTSFSFLFVHNFLMKIVNTRALRFAFWLSTYWLGEFRIRMDENSSKDIVLIRLSKRKKNRQIVPQKKIKYHFNKSKTNVSGNDRRSARITPKMFRSISFFLLLKTKQLCYVFATIFPIPLLFVYFPFNFNHSYMDRTNIISTGWRVLTEIRWNSQWLSVCLAFRYTIK